MARSLTLLGVHYQGERRYLRFSNKTELEFASEQQLQDWARSIDAEEEQLLMKLLIRWGLEHDGSGESLSMIAGKRITFELAGPHLLEVG